ncbi:MAG: hypothetical protein JKY37_23505 [Nannocystaceae bacterium]|nr:hypothetical protein [Nannocystaceae bacterium]
MDHIVEPVPLPEPVVDMVGVHGGELVWLAALKSGRVAQWRIWGAATIDDDARPIPGAVPDYSVKLLDGLEGVQAISRCGVVACAVTRGGDVVQWAPDPRGPPRHKRVLKGMGQPVAVAGGLDFVCALQTDGRVKCEGDNRQGQCGVGELSDRLEEAQYVVSPE